MRQQRWIESFDGTQIGYCVHGEGDKVIALCNGISCTDSYWKYLVQHLAAEYRIITWDYREHGVSHSLKDEDAITIGSHARDLKGILDKEGIDCSLIGGFSMGVQVSLEFYRLFPESCAGLLLVAGCSGDTLDNVVLSQLARVAFRVAYPVGVRFKRAVRMPVRIFLNSSLVYPFCRIVGMISSAASKEDMQLHYDSIANLDMGLFLRMIRTMDLHTAHDILPRVDVPTLIVAGERDFFSRYAAQEEMQKAIPHSELLTVKSGTHVLLIEQPELINHRVEGFLEERVWPGN